jgi:hypothetical protein
MSFPEIRTLQSFAEAMTMDGQHAGLGTDLLLSLPLWAIILWILA